MANVDLSSKLSAIELSDASDGTGVWPALVNVYQEQGYEAGYARGSSEALACALEAVEEFLRSQGGVDPQIRRMLYAYCEFLESRVQWGRGDDHHRQFTGGLGI